MKNIISHSLFSLKTYLCGLAFVLGGLLMPSAASAQSTLGWSMSVYGDANVPTISIQSWSRSPIVRASLFLTNRVENFDQGYAWISKGQDDGDPTTLGFTPGQAVQAYPGHNVAKTVDLNFNGNGLAMMESVVFVVDLDRDGCNCVQNFRDAFFSNDGNINNNAILYLETADGQSVTYKLPGQPNNQSSYFFNSAVASGVWPQFLTVRSIVPKEQESGELNNFIEIRNANVLVENTNTATFSPVFYYDLGQRRTSTNIGHEVSIPVFLNEKVKITAPEVVYWDSQTNDITQDVLSGAGAIELAVQRFIASGFSIDDEPSTGDKTTYLFTYTKPLRIDVRWAHEFALIIDHDFSASEVKDDQGNTYAGPLASYTTGDPQPAAKKHWLAKGESVLASIAGDVVNESVNSADPNSLLIRYIPIGFWAYGPAISGASDPTSQLRTFVGSEQLPHRYTAFPVSQAPPSRHAVEEFVMDDFARIEYVWKIQFGIDVAVDNPSRNNLPRVYANDFQILSGIGTVWVDPGTEVFVGSRANVLDFPAPALRGWNNGDDYYYRLTGKINSFDGSIVEGEPIGTGATWVPEFTDPQGVKFRGISIDRLKRPVRVTFEYGDQLIKEDVTIGQPVFSTLYYDGLRLADRFTDEPTVVTLVSVSGANKTVSDSQMTVWDEDSKRLFPVVPGEFDSTWIDPVSGYTVNVTVASSYPDPAHYPHIANTPGVALDPDPNDRLIFQEIKYTENDAQVSEGGLFTADTEGHTVLHFTEIDAASGRGDPRETVKIRVVETKRYNATGVMFPESTNVIGRKITDAQLDKANLGTGYLFHPGVRVNPDIYDASLLAGLGANHVYDMDALNSLSGEKVVTQPANLPGPIIPVNLHPLATENEQIIVVWYDDPVGNDNLLWPYASRHYIPRWPVNESEGLGRIVIASEYGSESLNAANQNQVVEPVATQIVISSQGEVSTNVLPAETTYNPSRFQALRVYHQEDPAEPGYNPNEEHALIAPSLRYAAVSPRPDAVYALRNNDLNVYNSSSSTASGQSVDYTSHPYVLTEYFDTGLGEHRMRVYKVFASTAGQYEFAPQADIVQGTSKTALQLVAMPHKTMEAGEPVISFYPLPFVIGASPCGNTFGENIKGVLTYWEDHKGGSWSVSGTENSWFTQSPYYPRSPDFWWPDGVSGKLYVDDDGSTLAGEPNIGDCLSFLPSNIGGLKALTPGTSISAYPAAVAGNKPTKILYKSDWPTIAPTLKAGETLTFQGGEYRADHPTSVVLDDGGNPVTVETPGLPAVLAFASGEVVFDSLNPGGQESLLPYSWTARIGQVLEVRRVILPVDNFPSELSPASGRTRVSQGKYVFSDLPASLQKRVRYNPLSQSVNSQGITINGKLEFFGLVNDKDIGEPTLSAAPPAVYVLEPNIMTVGERDALLALDEDENSAWDQAVEALFVLSRNPAVLQETSYTSEVVTNITVVPPVYINYGFAGTWFDPPDVVTISTNFISLTNTITDMYLVGLDAKTVRDSVTGDPVMSPVEPGSTVEAIVKDQTQMEPYRGYGPGLALIPNGNFLDPNGVIPSNSNAYPDVSWVTVVENNDPSLGGSPITPHVIRVDRRERYRGAIKTVESDNVFDENLMLRHMGDFGANADDLFFEWWYRPDDGSLNVPPPDLQKELTGSYSPWLLYPDPSGKLGKGRATITLKGNPTAPEPLLADTWWFARYRHKNDAVDDVDWGLTRPVGSGPTIFTWAGAGNSEPFVDADLNGVPDFKPQLAMGWIKRVLDAVNPYEARIRDFEGDSPATVVSMISQFGPRFEGPVALNPSKNVIENVGLIELYETVLKRGSDLSINLSTPISTPAIANALQLASTRISDFYTILGNEAYADAQDPTISYVGPSGTDIGPIGPAVFSFQNMVASLLEEELSLLRGVDENYARPVYNRMFWNFTKGEGEAAYALNYNIDDVNMDGFVNEDDAMINYPMGHGDAWGHYLKALKMQYNLLKHPYFNWVSRSEFYNLQDIPIAVDFLDERKFAQIASAKAKAGREVVDMTYRDAFVADPTAQWQGYQDTNPDRAWGVQGWARRVGQGTYFDWITANALLPSVHPNENLTGIFKVDRQENDDIRVVSANLNAVQQTFDNANKGYNPLGIGHNTVPFDIKPEGDFVDMSVFSENTHYRQIYDRALAAVNSAANTWDYAHQINNLVREVDNTEEEFRNSVYQEDLAYKNRLIEIFGKPYEGTIGSGKIYPAGYDGPDTLLYMYVHTREISDKTVPSPALSYATFTNNSAGREVLSGGDLYDAWVNAGKKSLNTPPLSSEFTEAERKQLAPTFVGSTASFLARDGYFSVNYTDVSNPKVNLDGLAQRMPVTAKGYTFQAPSTWGSRGAAGELQALISQMIRQEAQLAEAIAAYDAYMGSMVRTMRLFNNKIKVIDEGRTDLESTLDAVLGLEIGAAVIGIGQAYIEVAENTAEAATDAASEAPPTDTPTGGLAVSPGDVLSGLRSALKAIKIAITTSLAVQNAILETAKITLENIANGLEKALEKREAKREELIALFEMFHEIEEMSGDEPILRINVFREIEALRELSDHYVAVVDEGVRLIDERAAFNKRVAAQTQRERYRDMTFRVTRNHALQTYRRLYDIAALYTFLAARAYDYETNLDPAASGSPQGVYNEIVRSRNLGLLVDGQPAIGRGGLAEALAWLESNYDTLVSQLNITNPQNEVGKISLRSELFRIFPSGDTQPGGYPAPGTSSDDLWRQVLQDAIVPDLWDVPEFRYYCNPFEPQYDAGGNPVEQPGIVLRFGTEINPGKNFFGKPLSGGDHAYDSSLFATKVRSLGVWFNNYLSDSITNDLPETPRVYLVPVGQDVMRISSGANAGMLRYWNVVDQRIPVPLPALTSDLDQSAWIPLLDSLNGSFGEQRQFSSFRAYHNAGAVVEPDELVYDSRLVGRSIWNTDWMLIIPGRNLNADPYVGLNRLISQITDIHLLFDTYGYSGD